MLPPEVDLRDYPAFPVHLDRLFASDTWIICNSDEKVAAFSLWGKSWHQEPPGSLPNDDRLLANLAGYGVAVREWQKVKANALRGWIECSDGRLYHPVVCEIAADCWQKKKRKKEDNERDRLRKERKRKGVQPDVPRTEGVCPPDNTTMSAGSSDGKGSISDTEGKLREGKLREDPEPNGSVVPASSGPPPDPSAEDRAFAAISALGAYNQLAQRIGLTPAHKLTAARRSKLTRRIADAGGLDGWRAALAKVETSSFLCGGGPRGWKVDFDFLLQESKFAKLLEGGYDGGQPGGFDPAAYLQQTRKTG